MGVSIPLFANEEPCAQNSGAKCTESRLCQKFGQTLKALTTNFDEKSGLCIANVQSPLGKVKMKGAKNLSAKLSTFTFENTRSNASGLVTGQIAVRRRDLSKALAILKKDPKIRVSTTRHFRHVRPHIRYIYVQAPRDYVIRFARKMRAVLEAVKQ